jgi:uncharacterized protein YlxW (UPF0749 family)
VPPAAAIRSRVDAVPQLLTQIWDEALDPGYAAAAARRAVAAGAGQDAGTGTAGSAVGRRRVGAGLSLALVGLVLAAAIVQANASRPAVAQRRLDIIARIQAQTQRYDSVTSATAALQAEVDRLKSSALGATAAGQLLDQQLGRLELAASQVAVTGPGLRITMDDATTPGPGAASDLALGRVLDRDLQMVVNGLWAAGAEAVSINDQRLTSLSAIRSAGDAILVDYRPLTRPYLVLAIGDPKRIQAAFTAGPAGGGLRTLQQTYGVQYGVEGVDSVTLPAAPAVGLRYAQPQSVARKEGSP